MAISQTFIVVAGDFEPSHAPGLQRPLIVTPSCYFWDLSRFLETSLSVRYFFLCLVRIAN